MLCYLIIKVTWIHRFFTASSAKCELVKYKLATKERGSGKMMKSQYQTKWPAIFNCSEMMNAQAKSERRFVDIWIHRSTGQLHIYICIAIGDGKWMNEWMNDD